MTHRVAQRIAAARAIALLVFFVSAPAWADSIDELRTLIEAGDAQAWDMAQRMEGESAGDPAFDFWYALAAKAAGRKQQAVFALERVVEQQPGNMRARLELGDVYYQFGNTREAKAQFETVLASTPPDTVQQRIRSYIGVLDATEARQRTSLRGYVMVTGGYDSNINGATSTIQHDIPGIGIPLFLASKALEADAGFADLRVGLDLVQPVTQRDSRFLSVSAQARDNADILSGGNFDYTNMAVTGGWLKRRGTASWRIPLAVQSLRLEDDEARYLFTGGAEYSKPLSVNTAVTWFGHLAFNGYPSQESRETRQLLLGGVWHWSSTESPLRISINGNLGYEPAADSDFKANGRNFFGSRLNLRYPLSQGQMLYGALGLQHSTYQDEHPVLNITRKELLADMSVGWQRQLDKAWTINADLSHADNMSSGNDLFDYQRTTVSLGATWRF